LAGRWHGHVVVHGLLGEGAGRGAEEGEG